MTSTPTSDADRLPTRSKPVKVVRATGSPLNEKRWNVELACGHETWVTSVRAPKVARCPWHCEFSR